MSVKVIVFLFEELKSGLGSCFALKTGLACHLVKGRFVPADPIQTVALGFKIVLHNREIEIRGNKIMINRI